MNGKDVAVLLNNGIEGVNFTVEDGKAATIKPETPEGKAVSTDIKSYAQLGMNVAGNNFYPVKQATDYEQQVFDKRTEVMAEDLKSAVYNPAAAVRLRHLRGQGRAAGQHRGRRPDQVPRRPDR